MQVEEASAALHVLAHAAHAKCSVLLLEPYFVLRQTVAAVARGLDVAEIRQAVNFEAAEKMLRTERLDGCVLAIGEERREIALIERLRAGQCASAASIPIAVMIDDCDAKMALVFRELRVSRILLKPFKVKAILETMAQIVERIPFSR